MAEFTKDASPSLDRPLTRPMLIRGVFDNQFVLGMFCLGCLLLFCCWLDWHSSTSRRNTSIENLVCLGCAILLMLPQMVLLVIRFHNRRWLEVTTRGFILTERGKASILSDQQVVGLAHWYSVDSSGNTIHRLRLEIQREGKVEHLRCQYRIRANQPDPLFTFWDRLCRDLAQRTLDGLDSGATLVGEGWYVDRTGLHWRSRGSDNFCPLDRLTRVVVVEQELSIWKEVDEEAFLKFSFRGQNAGALLALLCEAMNRSGTGSIPLPNKPLGRVLLDRRSPDARFGVVLLIVSLIFGMVIACFTFRVRKFEVQSVLNPALLVVVLIQVPALILIRWSSRIRIRFHENGISQPGGTEPRELLYAEIGSITYSKGPRLRFEPLPVTGKPALHYTALGLKPDLEVHAMVLYATRLVAERWSRGIPAGPIVWTPRLRFLPTGLEYRTSGMFGDGEPVTVPYAAITFHFDQMYLNLYIPGQSRPVARERLGTVNLYVGLTLLQMLQTNLLCAGFPKGTEARAPRQGVLQLSSDGVQLQPLPGRITLASKPERDEHQMPDPVDQ